MANQRRRQTKRERKELAKQRKLEEIKRLQRKQRMRRIGSVVTALAVIGAIAAFVAFRSGQSAQALDDLNAKAVAAGCTEVQEHASEGRGHINPPQRVSYKTVPPTSGEHYPTTAPTGFVDTVLQPENFVHNLEHGHIAVLTKSAPDGALAKALGEVVADDPTRILSAQYPQMDDEVAILAWARSITCAQVTDPDAIKEIALEFAAQFKGKGPEGDIPGTPGEAADHSESTPAPTSSETPASSPETTASPAGTPSG